MHTTTIYYSIENNGDGSASTEFFTTAKLANWHQDNLHEGWGEPCTGSLSLTHEGPVAFDKKVLNERQTLELLRAGDMDGDLHDFIDRFFGGKDPSDLSADLPVSRRGT